MSSVKIASEVMDVDEVGFNKLSNWLNGDFHPIAVIGGSATPYLTLDEIIRLSRDAATTRAALDFGSVPFSFGSGEGSKALRQTIAQTYRHALSGLTEDHILVNNGTTGSNHIALQTILQSGDHVICQYPIYGPSIEEPERIGCEISYLCLDAGNEWKADLGQLVRLIKPGKTKMLLLNSPVNPTGTHFGLETQREMINLCRQYDIFIHCDEIFRPLYHEDGDLPPSFIEHAQLDYDKIIVTSSLSKAYGLSGVRVGWIATRSPILRKRFHSYRVMSCGSLSTIDEIIATEVLGERCRPGVLQKHLQLARDNIETIQRFIDKHSNILSWVRPSAGAVGFVKITDPRTNLPADDLAFCRRLLERKGVLLSPGSACFEYGHLKEVCAGRVRLHFTATREVLQKSLDLLEQFLVEEFH